MAAPHGLVSVLAFGLLLATVSAFDNSVKFSYTGSTGPLNWGHLSDKFASCSSGKTQSPINLVKDKVVLNKSLTPLVREYRPTNATLVNNGLSIGVAFEGEVGPLMVGGTNYSLKQTHWHTPSEHTIDGVRYPAEQHLFHKAQDGSIAVVAILFEYGKPDRFLKKIEKELKQLAQETCGEDEESHIPLKLVNPKNIKKHTRKYYRYIGSTTTPPCTEQVVWSIFGKVRTISKEQVQALEAPLKSDCKRNCRPVQPLNGRQVQLYDEHSD